jgi:nucleotide-binding universal stress UspA family protein
MYHKVVVPLDGSKLAEVALTHLEEIAKGCGITEIHLISVTEKVKGSLPRSQAFDEPAWKPGNSSVPIIEQGQTGLIFSSHITENQQIPITLGKMARTAFNYLYKIARKLAKDGYESHVNVLLGNPAEEIVRFAEEQKADLIIMASRGKSGFSRWDMGNIAEKVIRATSATVMLAKPGPGFKETKPKRKGEST